MVEFPSELIIDGQNGVYVFDADEDLHFEKRCVWAHELALKEFFTQQFLTKNRSRMKTSEDINIFEVV